MAADMSRVRYCVCGRPGFEYNDGIWRCLVGHEVAEDLDVTERREAS